MKNTSLPLKAFKRAPSLKLSKWYMGMLLTNLTETQDTNGAFAFFEATLVPGTEPPPHMHSREDELFYVLEGEFDVYVGEEVFNGKTGDCIFLPRFKPHAFIIRSPRLRLLILFAPAGVEEAFRSVSSPAQKFESPPRSAYLLGGRFGADSAAIQYEGCTDAGYGRSCATSQIGSSECRSAIQ